MATEQIYKSVLTPFGKSAAINAYNGGASVNIKYMGVGDGGGNEYTPEFGQENLRGEWLEIEAHNKFVDPKNPAWLVTEGFIREDVGGHYIREISLKDEEHNVIAVASVASRYKPILAEGSTSAMVIRCILEVSDTSVFELKIDTSLAVVTRDEFLRYVEQTRQEINELASIFENMPQATVSLAGVAMLATQEEIAEGTNDNKIVTPAALSAAGIANASMKFSENSQDLDLQPGKFGFAIINRHFLIKSPEGQLYRIQATLENDTFTDPRDGRTYRAVKIGSQVWMAENLNYNAAGSLVYNNDQALGNIYGRLYDWDTARTIAPPGWHLPTDAEWDTLVAFVHADKGLGAYTPGEHSALAGKYLKSAGGWNDYSGASGCGTDDYGFSALPGGSRYTDGSFPLVGGSGYWWSATESGSSSAYTRRMYYSSENVLRNNYAKAHLFSVRCLQD